MSNSIFKSIETYTVDTTAGKTITGPGIACIVYKEINTNLDYYPLINIDGLNSFSPEIGGNYLFKNSLKLYTNKSGYEIKAVVAVFN